MIVAGFHERGEGFVEHRQGKFAKSLDSMDGAQLGNWYSGGFNGAINGQSAVVVFGECRGAAGVGGALRWLSRAQHVIAPLPGPAIAL